MSAIDSAHLSIGVNLTYLKSFVTREAKKFISGFLLSVVVNALKTIILNFGQPQRVVKAHLEKVTPFRTLMMRFLTPS